MQNNNSKRVLLFAFAFILCFNLSFSKPKDVQAFDPVTVAAACLAFLGVSICATVVCYNNQYTCERLMDGYNDWVYQNRPDIFRDVTEAVSSGRIDTTDNSSIYTSVFKGFFNVMLLKEIVGSVYDFLETKGTFTDATYTPNSTNSEFVNLDDIYNVACEYFTDYYGVAPNDTVKSALRSQLDNADYPYVTFVSGLNYTTNFDYQYFGFIRCQDSYMDIVERSNHNYDAVGDKNKTTKSFSNDFSKGVQTYPYYGFSLSNLTILGQYYYSPAAESAGDELALTEDGQEMAADSEAYAQKVAEDYADTVIQHYTDGSTAVDEGAEIDVPFGPAADDDGVVVPLEPAYPLADAIKEGVTDWYVGDKFAGDETSARDKPTSSSWYSKILDWIKSFWNTFTAKLRSFGDYLLDGIKDIFIPSNDDIQDAIDRIKQAFNNKFNFDGFELASVFGEPEEIGDVSINNYGYYGFSAVIIRFSFLRDALTRFRPIIRGIVGLMLILFNIDQLFNFMGLGGLAAGAREHLTSVNNKDKGG